MMRIAICVLSFLLLLSCFNSEGALSIPDEELKGRTFLHPILRLHVQMAYLHTRDERTVEFILRSGDLIDYSIKQWCSTHVLSVDSCKQLAVFVDEEIAALEARQSDIVQQIITINDTPDLSVIFTHPTDSAVDAEPSDASLRSQVQDILTMNVQLDVHKLHRTIWILWFEGWANAPLLVRKCLASWQRHNPDWSIIQLDGVNLSQFVDLQAFLPGVNLREIKLSQAHLSDIVRVALLRKYGGLWVDATVMCHAPLSEWFLPHLVQLQTGLFFTSNEQSHLLLSTWFLYAAQGHCVLDILHVALERYWAIYPSVHSYFWMHDVLRLLYHKPEDVLFDSAADAADRMDWGIDVGGNRNSAVWNDQLALSLQKNSFDLRCLAHTFDVVLQHPHQPLNLSQMLMPLLDEPLSPALQHQIDTHAIGPVSKLSTKTLTTISPSSSLSNATLTPTTVLEYLLLVYSP